MSASLDGNQTGESSASEFALVRVLPALPGTACDPLHLYNASSGAASLADEDNLLDIASIALCLFNALANGLSFAIFINKAFNRSITSVLLTGLSVFETAFQLGQSGFLTIGLLRACCLPPLPSRSLAVGLAGLAVLARQTSATFQLARNWTLAGLSYYRYEAVCRSTSGARLFRQETCGRVLIGAALLCALTMLPRLFEAYETVCLVEPPGHFVLGSTGPYKPVYANQYYQIFYLSGCLFLLQSGGPAIVVLVCSAYVLKVLWARQRFRETHNLRRKSGTDKLIIMLALTFFVLEMPAFFSKLLYAFKALPKETEVTLSKWSNMLITLDSSMNIFIYLVSNPTFLQVAKQLFCRRELAQVGGRGQRDSSNDETINATKSPAGTNQQQQQQQQQQEQEQKQLPLETDELMPNGMQLCELQQQQQKQQLQQYEVTEL